MKFIIEHLDKELHEWSLIEYRHISKIVNGNVIFTNVKNNLSLNGDVKKESVSELGFENICVLDSDVEQELVTEDKFDYYVFGGILGDDPPQKRTEKLIKKFKGKVHTRNLGNKQMSTDTAVLVTKKILDGGKLSDINFKDGIEIDVREGESVMLPYRYVIENNEPVISDELLLYLKKKEDF